MNVYLKKHNKQVSCVCVCVCVCTHLHSVKQMQIQTASAVKFYTVTNYSAIRIHWRYYNKQSDCKSLVTWNTVQIQNKILLCQHTS
jgi:hypothetical protein